MAAKPDAASAGMADKKKGKNGAKAKAGKAGERLCRFDHRHFIAQMRSTMNSMQL
jgi:hypothetical protein